MTSSCRARGTRIASRGEIDNDRLSIILDTNADGSASQRHRPVTLRGRVCSSDLGPRARASSEDAGMGWRDDYLCLCHHDPRSLLPGGRHHDPRSSSFGPAGARIRQHCAARTAELVDSLIRASSPRTSSRRPEPHPLMPFLRSPSKGESPRSSPAQEDSSELPFAPPRALRDAAGPLSSGRRMKTLEDLDSALYGDGNHKTFLRAGGGSSRGWVTTP